MRYLLLVVLAVAVVYSIRAQRTDGFPVRTTYAHGTLEGTYDVKSRVQQYFGVPFAAPPVGDLRWRPPQPVEPWEGVREAHDFGPRAVQPFAFDDMRFRSAGVSEDCLYLNVWTSARHDQEAALPVLLYFHGGGNFAGGGSESRYDGEALAQRGIIVVTANYRLGPFGFLAHPDLTAESGYGGSGNYGLMDQAAALRWVHDHIAAFGGDPDRITIAGESAGSMDVSALLVSPLSRDRVGGALGQSGAMMFPTSAPVPVAEAEAVGVKLLEAIDLAGIDALRALDTRTLFEKFNSSNMGGLPEVIDNHFFVEDIPTAYAAGRVAGVPLMIGWTSHEMAWLPPPADPNAYTSMVKQRYGNGADGILSAYPAEDYTESFYRLVSDAWIVLSTYRWFDLHRTHTEAPIYRYRFDRVRPPLVGQPRDQEPPGAGHATDIEYFMGTLDRSPYAWQAEDRATEQTMSGYLLNFVKTGNPNGEKLPAWPSANDSLQTPVMLLDAESRAVMATHDDRFKVLEEVLREQ